MNIGETIRLLRQEHGLSQEEMAEQFHVTRQSISNWENNRNYPDLKTLIDMSHYFHISLDKILENDSDYVRDNVSNIKHSQKRKRIIIGLIAVIVILTALIIVLLCTRDKILEHGPLKLNCTNNMNIGNGNENTYINDLDLINEVTKTLSGNYATQKQVIINYDKLNYDYIIHLWDDPDGLWEEIIILDNRHIVYNGWKCKKIDSPIDLGLIKEAFSFRDDK